MVYPVRKAADRISSNDGGLNTGLETEWNQENKRKNSVAAKDSEAQWQDVSPRNKEIMLTGHCQYKVHLVVDQEVFFWLAVLWMYTFLLLVLKVSAQFIWKQILVLAALAQVSFQLPKNKGIKRPKQTKLFPILTASSS